MNTIAIPKVASHSVDLMLAVHIGPGYAYYERSNALLARASTDGLLELLTAAWERALGYGRREFAGKTLRQLLKPGQPADTVAAILDNGNMEPVELTLCCRNGTPKSLRLHRRFDAYVDKMFIVAEETCVRERTEAAVKN
jgi:hypothetical protein